MNETLQRSAAILAWMVLPVIGGFVLWRLWLSRLADGHVLAGKLARISSQTSILLLIPPMFVFAIWKAMEYGMVDRHDPVDDPDFY